MPPVSFRQPFAQFVLLDVGRGVFVEALDLGAPGADRRGVALALQDRGMAGAGLHPLGAAEIGRRDVLDPPAKIAGDHPSAGQDRHVLEQSLAPMAVLGRMDDEKAAGRPAAEQAGDDLGRHLLGDHQQRPTGLGSRARAPPRATPGSLIFRSVIRISGRSSAAVIVSWSVTM